MVDSIILKKGVRGFFFRYYKTVIFVKGYCVSGLEREVTELLYAVKSFSTPAISSFSMRVKLIITDSFSI